MQVYTGAGFWKSMLPGFFLGITAFIIALEAVEGSK